MKTLRASRPARSGPEQSGRSVRPPRTGLQVLVAGIAYTAAWVVGLALWPTNLDVHASDDTVLTSYAGHAVAASGQTTLVHGLAALALAIVVVALARAGRAAGAVRESFVAAVAGLAAAAVSLIQWALDLTLAWVIAPSGDAGRAGIVLEAINRLDGVKMLLLATLAAAGAALARRRVLPSWLGIVGALLAVAITTSGIGYLLLIPPLALVAAASLPLLLIWVTSVGVLQWRHNR
jgi:hypothetical protein